MERRELEALSRGARLRTIAMAGLALLGVALMGSVVVTFLTVVNRHKFLTESIREDAVWAAYQIDGESKKLGIGLSRLGHTPSSEALAYVNTRFDILYSRIGIIADGGYAGKFDADAETSSLTDQVKDAVFALVPDFDRLAAPGVDAASEEIQDLANDLEVRLQTVIQPSERLLNVVNLKQARLRSDARENERVTYTNLAIAVAALVATLGIIVVALGFNLRQTLASSKQSAEAAERAEAGTRAKSIFLATMSHEIRTPLNGIIGSVELLNGKALDPDERESVDIIRDCSDALLELIDDILDFSKLESGEVKIERRRTRLADVVASVESVIRPRASDKGLVLSFDAQDMEIECDPARLRQVLLNLAGNAVKFTDSGSVEVRFRTGTDTGRMDVEVVDSGIGIPKDKLSRLFNDFSQVDETINRRFGGTGLGLAICRRLVVAMGGEIGVDSVSGEGSRFWFSIPAGPIVQAPAEAAPNSMDDDHAPLRGHVLVAEDSDINLRVIGKLLHKLGLTFDHAPDGAIATYLAGMMAYDAILMDVQMPNMDGLAATRSIRSKGNAVPIFGVTANAFESDRTACLEAGMTGFLPKPITMAALRDAMVSAIESRVEHPVEEGVPAKVAPAEEAIVDWRYRGAMEREIGEDAIAELTREFWQDATGMLARSMAAFETGDLRTCAHELHTMKGVAATLGLSGLSGLARRGQSDGERGDRPDVAGIQSMLMKSMLAVDSGPVVSASDARAAA